MPGKITTLFLDIGGVLLTNGWGGSSRKKAAEKFNLDYQELDKRHRLVFDTFEIGKLTLDEYLSWIVFYQPRQFSQQDFKEFMFSQSEPFTEMINFIAKVKKEYNLKVGVVSNEGKELSDYRVKKFNLKSFIDFFLISGLVHLRKPDSDIYRFALNIAQANPNEVIYIEDRELFVKVAEKLNIHAIQHNDQKTTENLVKKLLSR